MWFPNHLRVDRRPVPQFRCNHLGSSFRPSISVMADTTRAGSLLAEGDDPRAPKPVAICRGYFIDCDPSRDPGPRQSAQERVVWQAWPGCSWNCHMAFPRTKPATRAPNMFHRSRESSRNCTKPWPRPLRSNRLEGCKGYDHGHHQTVNRDHGCIETRLCRYIGVPEYIRHGDSDSARSTLRSLVMSEVQRYLGSHVTLETRCFLANVPTEARSRPGTAHSHCGVENSLHQVPDMAFQKDESCIHTGYTERNMSIPRCLVPACCAARPLQREASRPSASRLAS